MRLQKALVATSMLLVISSQPLFSEENSPLLLATWRAYQDGNSWGIREGDNKLPLGVSEKKARKAAKKINKALEEEKGFKAEESGPCADPNSGVRC